MMESGKGNHLSWFIAGTVVGGMGVLLFLVLGFIPQSVDFFGVQFAVPTSFARRPCPTCASFPSPTAFAIPSPTTRGYDIPEPGEDTPVRYEDAVRPIVSTTPLWGPNSGAIYHYPENKGVEEYSAGVEVRDFVTEAKFYVPFIASKGKEWDAGFFVRESFRPEYYYAVFIASSGVWKVVLKTEEASKAKIIAQGKIGTTFYRTGGFLFSIWCKRDTMYLFINKKYIDAVNAGELMKKGDVSVATGFAVEDEQAGAKTKYEDFAVWSLEP